MKLIHLSDLHLGKRIHEISMLEEQAFILQQILDAVKEENADAVLIAGDVYDKSLPPVEAISLFDSFLGQLSGCGIPVFLISGNHDSPERLAFGKAFLKLGNIHVSPAYDGNLHSVTLEDSHGPVTIWLLPFLKPVHVRRFFPEESIETYTQACQSALSRCRLQPGHRNVLVTHQFVTGGLTCESEELSVGGSDNVDAAVFDAFDYVALGHLHGPQNIGSNRIRYSGSPLKYSFSESTHHKSITVVELGPKGELTLRLIPLLPKHDLRQLRGSFRELTDPVQYQKTDREDYLHLILTDEEDIPEAIGKLQLIYPNLLKLSYDNTRTRTNQILTDPVNAARKSPLALFRELYRLQNNTNLSPVQEEYMKTLIESVWEDQL